MINTDDGFVPLLTERAKTDPDCLYARFCGTPIAFGELEGTASRLAVHLRRAGISPGDRVALMVRNSPRALALLFAIAKARAVWVPINVQSRGDNLGYVLDHSAPKLIIADGDLVATVRSSAPKLDETKVVTIDALSEPAPILNPHEDGALWDEPPPAADDTFAIMYTSGTTGRAKGVLVSHRMLRLAGEAVALVSNARVSDVMLMWEPLYHIGGAQMIVLPLIRNVTLAMVEGFSARRFWSDVKKHGASHIHFLGGILQILLKQPTCELDRCHGARIAWGGGCPPELWRAFEERFGLEIRECYGMTECSSISTYNDAHVVGSIGRPVPWFSVKLVGPAGQPLAGGERGEIVVRTDLPGAITRGYWMDRGATAEALCQDGFHTGDLGSMDEAGNMYFRGRMTDSVRVKGENVSAFEVEQVAAKHPAVEDCAMIGVAASIGEQEIKLVVKRRAGTRLQPQELSAWLSERLAPYQNPRYIAFVDDFARTGSQRIIKHMLPARTDDAWDRMADAPHWRGRSV
jgi:carnitine-CoA ligase